MFILIHLLPNTIVINWFILNFSIGEAIGREKNLKNWKREWKNDLINFVNREWKDLFDEIEDW